MWQAVRRELTGALRSVRYDLYQHSGDQAPRPRPLRRLGYVVGGTALLSAAGGFAVVQLVPHSTPAPPPAAFPAPPHDPSAGTLGAHEPEPSAPAPTPRKATPAPPPTPRAATRAPSGAGATTPGRPADPRAVWQGRRMPAATLVPGVPAPPGPRRTPPPRPGQAVPEDPPTATPVVRDTRRRTRLYQFRDPRFDGFRGRYRGHGHAHRDPYRR